MTSVIRGDDNFDSSSVGPSTDYNAVGTYGIYGYAAGGVLEGGATLSGSSFRRYKSSYINSTPQGTWGNATANNGSSFSESAGLGGTYRVMQHRWRGVGGTGSWMGVFVVRIS